MDKSGRVFWGEERGCIKETCRCTGEEFHGVEAGAEADRLWRVRFVCGSCSFVLPVWKQSQVFLEGS